MKSAKSEYDLTLRILMFSLILISGFIAFISLDVYSEVPAIFVSPNLARETLFLPILSLLLCSISLFAIRSARKSRTILDSSLTEASSLRILKF